MTERIDVRRESGCPCFHLFVAYIDGEPVAWGRTAERAQEIASQLLPGNES